MMYHHVLTEHSVLFTATALCADVSQQFTQTSPAHQLSFPPWDQFSISVITGNVLETIL